ncbi:MAG TPA: RDD family protein [Candidatus Limnocylindria bacterium]|nr:RDD family protein [Candidatus Limnocylindria bacterium]
MTTTPTTATTATNVDYGGFWIRVLAFILDAIVLGVITSAATPLFGTGPVINTGPGEFGVNYGSNAIGTLIGLLYMVGFWSLRGQTPGMIPFNLRVVRASDGSRPDWVVSLLRYVGLIISFAVIFIGVIWVAFDGRKQGWHDKIAGTVVVRDRG